MNKQLHTNPKVDERIEDGKLSSIIHVQPMNLIITIPDYFELEYISECFESTTYDNYIQTFRRVR